MYQKHRFLIYFGIVGINIVLFSITSPSIFPSHAQLLRVELNYILHLKLHIGIRSPRYFSNNILLKPNSLFSTYVYLQNNYVYKIRGCITMAYIVRICQSQARVTQIQTNEYHLQQMHWIQIHDVFCECHHISGRINN